MNAPTGSTPCHEVFAIRFGSQPRRRRANFFPTDDHDGDMPLDYYVWLIRNDDQVILVDTGFGAEAAAKRQRGRFRCPIEALSLLGVSADQVEHVVITHLHYDHAGNLDKLPNATFHVQEEEVRYATGPCMCHALLRFAYSPEDLSQLIHHTYRGRVTFHSGSDVLAPGVELIHLGGHTSGFQCVRVHTRRGWVVIASDAAHYYDNLARRNPFPIVHNVADALSAFDKLREIAASESHIVPGHDPLVIKRFPCLEGDDIGIALLHLDPLKEASAAP